MEMQRNHLSQRKQAKLSERRKMRDEELLGRALVSTNEGEYAREIAAQRRRDLEDIESQL